MKEAEGSVDASLTEATVIRMTDNREMVAFFSKDPLSLLWSYGEFLSSFKCKRKKLIVPWHAFISSGIDVRKMDPNFVMTTLILLFKPPACHTGW